MTKLNLKQGERFRLTNENEYIILTEGMAEIYASSQEESSSSYRQMFLMEMIAGEAAFPATTNFQFTSIFIYAVNDVTIEVYPLKLAKFESLRKHLREWFAHLQRVPFLNLIAKRGDDILQSWSTIDFLSEATDVDSLISAYEFNQEILTMLIGGQFKSGEVDSLKRLELKSKQDEKLIKASIQNLVAKDDEMVEETLTLNAKLDEVTYIVKKAAAYLHMPTDNIQISAEIAKKMDHLTLIKRLIKKGGMNMRPIKFEKGWEKMDSGVIISELNTSGKKKHIAVLLPETPSSYKMVTKEYPDGRVVDEEILNQLPENAFAIYAGFPARKLKIWDLLKFMFRQCWIQDYRTVILVSMVGGIIPMLTPIITETIFADIIPIQDREGLATVTQVMMVTGFTTAALSLVQSIALMRISERIDMSSEAALWSRLLSMPTSFFRKFQTGELLSRMAGMGAVKGFVTGQYIGAIFSFIFSFWSIFLMCYYSIKLTAAAMALWLVYFVVIALIYRRVLYFQRQLIEAGNKTSGQVQQIFTGLPKFRTQNAETQAFNLWTKVFGEQWKWNLKLRWQGNYNAIIGSVQPFLLTLLLYYIVMYGMTEVVNGVPQRTINYPQFLAFSAAFSAFNGTVTSIIPLVVQIFAAMPHIENMKPIMETEPEVTEDKVDADVLTGAMEISHLSFGYLEGKEVLHDVSFSVKSGETLAIVGPSGSGKSTLMRLLLGFETPNKGAIYYDGQALADVSVSSIRSQMGVVLQNGQIMAGDIFTNIVGTGNLTMNDAWEAARKVGIAEDIEAMPMGMFTMISEGSGNISGGQRQRLLIARAIARKPAILILDEATSALDNRTQAIVTDSLKEMHCTRIVVAHRLSTIRDADRILVMESGKIIEEGNYDELVAAGGLFAQLVARQVA